MEVEKYNECSLFRRVMVSLAVVLLVRCLYFVPVPGVNLSAVIEFYQQQIKPHGGGPMDMIALLHIGKLRNISLCSLGIMPFVNACIILQIISFLVPGLNRKFFFKKNGRSKMMLATIIIALMLSVFYGYQASLDLELLNQFPGFSLLNFSGFPFHLSTILSLSAIGLVFVLLTQLINKYGFGNCLCGDNQTHQCFEQYPY